MKYIHLKNCGHKRNSSNTVESHDSSKENISPFISAGENSGVITNETPLKRPEWKRREVSIDKRNISRISSMQYPAAENLENYQISFTETPAGISQDSWYVRNPQPAPRYHEEQIFADSLHQPFKSYVQRIPIYKVNTCYIKPDGTNDCQT